MSYIPGYYKPVRTFIANEGEYSVDDRGPEALKFDLDEINKMFDPTATHEDGEQGGIDFENLKFDFADEDFSTRIGSPKIEDLGESTNVAGQLYALNNRINETNRSIKYLTFKDYVTPEMFGAVGDGETDDTEAFQEAINSEHDVCLIGYYLIKDTLFWNKSGKIGKNIFSLTQTRWVPQTKIWFDPEDRTKPCFEFQSDGLTLQNVGVKGIGERDLTFIKTNIDPVDVDMSLINCVINNFYTIVDITGRGLDITDCVISQCTIIAKIAWKYESDGIYHNDATGQRAYNIHNNRFHSMSDTGEPLIQISSGNLYGFRFTDNNFDRGYSPLLSSDSNIDNWIIADNTFIGVRGNDTGNHPFMYFLGTVSRLTIANNHFVVADKKAGTQRIAEFLDDVDTLMLSDNLISEMVNCTPFAFMGNLSNSIISGNTFRKNTNVSTNRGFIYFQSSKSLTNCVISNNIVGETTYLDTTEYATYLIRCSGTLYFVNTKIIGNIVSIDNGSGDQLSVYNLQQTNCLFDWELLDRISQLNET